MKTRTILFSLVILVTILIAACSPQAAPTEIMPEKEMAEEAMDDKDAAMMEDKEDDMMAEEGAEMSDHGSDDMMDDKDDEMMPESDDAMMEEKDDGMMAEEGDSMMDDSEKDMAEDAMMSPAWFKAELTNARTGETFTIADFKGKVVLVETLAMWCSNCLKQQGQVQALHDLLGERDDFVSLGVDIDPNENAAALQAYIDKNGFDWLYTVAPTEVSREIGQLYGDQFLNPPSTPMLIIDRHGEAHPLPFGIKSAESLLEALQPFLDGDM